MVLWRSQRTGLQIQFHLNILSQAGFNNWFPEQLWSHLLASKDWQIVVVLSQKQGLCSVGVWGSMYMYSYKFYRHECQFQEDVLCQTSHILVSTISDCTEKPSDRLSYVYNKPRVFYPCPHLWYGEANIWLCLVMCSKLQR